MNRIGYVLPALFGAFVVAGCQTTEEYLLEAQSQIDSRLAEARSATETAPTVKLAGTTMFDALRTAVESNGGYRAALSQESASLYEMDAASGARRPQVTGSALAGRTYEGSPSDQQTTGAAADVMLTQVLFDGGASKAALDQATAEALAARAQAQETGNRIALEAYTAWTRLWLARQRVALIDRQARDVAVLMEQLSRMTDSGMIDSSLGEGARMSQIEIRLEQSRLRSDVRVAEAEFIRFFGSAVPDVARPTAVRATVALSADLPSGSAPALRAAAARLLVAEAALDAAKASRKPTANLRAGVTSPMDTDETTDTSVGLQLNYVFGDGGTRKARVAAAEARRDALEAELADAQSQARALLDASRSRLAALDAAAEMMAERIAAATQRSETATAQIALGQSNLNQLIDSRISTYRASDQQLQMEAERLILLAEIAAGTGELLAALGIGDAPKKGG